MVDDGGIADAQAGLVAKQAFEAQRQEAEDDALEGALREQGSRLEAAITAFLKAVSSKGIPSERFVIGRRQVGPKPRPRFGRDERGVWGFHSRPIPTEPIYGGGYTIHYRENPSEIGGFEQKIILRPNGRLELQEIWPRRRTSLWGKPEEDLPFYLGHGGQLVDRATSAGPLGRDLGIIQETTDWLVQRLAAYLLDHSPS